MGNFIHTVCKEMLEGNFSFLILVVGIAQLIAMLRKTDRSENVKMFKSVDKKFAELGFVKVSESHYGVTYEREVEQPNFIQVIQLKHRPDDRHIIQSYDKNLFDVENIGNTCVGLSVYEAKLCIKKMKELGWKLAN